MPNCDMCFAPLGPDGLCLNNPHHHQRPSQQVTEEARVVPILPDGVQVNPSPSWRATTIQSTTISRAAYENWVREQADRINQSMVNIRNAHVLTEGEVPMPPRSTVADTVERVTRPASNVDTMTKFGLSEPDWKALPMPCKFALIEAAGLLKEPPRVEDDFVPGIFMVMGSDCDGENYESLVAAPNRDAAIQCFMDYTDREEWDSGPYVYKIPARSSRRGVLNWVNA